MADRSSSSSSTLLTFIACFLALPLMTGSFDFFGILQQHCFSECPAKYFTSTYKVPCSDRCDKHGYSYYWCKSPKGWDYCSPGQNIDYKGNTCLGTCQDYSGGYKCSLFTGGWSKCARVEPSALIHYTRQAEKCIDDCQYYGSGDYFWCHTEKGWDYCSPLPDYTYKGESCRYAHSCGTHGSSFSWCYTSYINNWDYCGKIGPGECTYTKSYRRKRQSGFPRVICTRKDEYDNNRVTRFLDKGGQNQIKPVTKKQRNEILDLINKWNNQRLSGQSRSNLIRSANFRIDNQGLCNNQRCYNLQIQENVARPSGRSTTVSLIVVPVDTSAEYMRLAFKYSLDGQVGVQVEVNEEPTPAPKCCRRRKK